MEQSITVKWYRAKTLDDYSEIIGIARHDINIINRRIREFNKAAEDDAYHVKEIRRIAEDNNLLTKRGYISKTGDLSALPKESLQELVYELEAFRTSKVGTVKRLIASDEKRIDKLLRNPRFSAHADKLTRQRFKDFVKNETIQRALAKESGITSNQLIDDYLSLVDDKTLTFDVFTERIEKFLDSENKYASYFDYIKGEYDNVSD